MQYIIFWRSIVAFKLFDCEDFHSEYRVLEVTSHLPLTDKFSMHYFELPKLPKLGGGDDKLKLWLSLFRAETEEELKQIEATGEPEMEQAIKAYHHITATSEFRELERLRELARHNEAAALRHAAEVEREKWQGVVADKDAALAKHKAALANKDAEIKALRARLGESK